MQLGSLSKLYSGTSLVKAAYVGSNRFYRNISAQSAVNGFVPGLCFDFVKDAYATDSRPATFGDSITHSASTNGTMVDSDGVLKWRPHNLLTYSNAFSNAVWYKDYTPIIAQDETGPDGTANTAWTITDNDAVNREGLARFGAGSIVINADSAQYDFCLFVKKTTGAVTFPGMQLFLSGGTTQNGGVMINTNTGTLTDRATFSPANKSITEVGGFWLVCITMVNNGTNTGLQPEFYPSITASDTGTWDNTLTGSAVIYGGHLYRSDLGGMVNNPDTGNSYVPTTSAARYLPRRGHHVWNGSAWVNEGLLHESEARTNLLTYSQDFTDASWATSSVGVSVSPNDTISPDGNNNAAKITSTGATSYFGKNTTSGTSAFTVRVKYINNQWVALNFGGGATTAVWFDVQNGTVGTETSGYTGLISNVGGGWYECTIVGNNANNVVYIWPAVNGDGTVLGTSGKSCHIYGAQLEEVSTPSSYIPTSGSTVTRAVETLTIPAAKLPWPTPNVIGPELVTNGTFDTDVSGWAAYNGATISWESGRIKAVKAGSYGGFDQSISGLTVGKVYTVSGELEVINFDAGQIWTSEAKGGLHVGIQTLGAGLNAYSFRFVATATTMWINARGNIVSGTGTVYGDNISVREIDPLSVSIQMDGRVTYADTDEVVAVNQIRWQADASNRIYQFVTTSGGATGKFGVQQISGGVVDSSQETGNTLVPGILTSFNTAGRHGSTFIRGAIDGTLLPANTTPTALPDLSTTDLSLGYDYMGTIRTFRMWDQDITDGGLVEATAPSLEPSLSLTFDGTENSFIVQDWRE